MQYLEHGKDYFLFGTVNISTNSFYTSHILFLFLKNTIWVISFTYSQLRIFLDSNNILLPQLIKSLINGFLMCKCLWDDRNIFRWEVTFNCKVFRLLMTLISQNTSFSEINRDFYLTSDWLFFPGVINMIRCLISSQPEIDADQRIQLLESIDKFK